MGPRRVFLSGAVLIPRLSTPLLLRRRYILFPFVYPLPVPQGLIVDAQPLGKLPQIDFLAPAPALDVFSLGGVALLAPLRHIRRTSSNGGGPLRLQIPHIETRDFGGHKPQKWKKPTASPLQANYSRYQYNTEICSLLLIHKNLIFPLSLFPQFHFLPPLYYFQPGPGK